MSLIPVSFHRSFNLNKIYNLLYNLHQSQINHYLFIFISAWVFIFYSMLASFVLSMLLMLLLLLLLLVRDLLISDNSLLQSVYLLRIYSLWNIFVAFVVVVFLVIIRNHRKVRFYLFFEEIQVVLARLPQKQTLN